MAGTDYVIVFDDGANYPKIVMVTDELIAKTDDEIDAILPDELKRIGTLIFNPDYSVIKNRDFDGSWVEVDR